MLAIFEITPGRDRLIGQAADKHTATSLVELAFHKCATGVSLHGILPGKPQISGEMSIHQALAWIDD